MTRSSIKDGRSNPSQAVRLLWFFLIFLSPAGAVVYVSTHGLEYGNEAALIRALAILAISLMVSLFCAIAQPIQCYDEIGMTRAGRASLCLAIFDTIIFALLMHGPSSVGQACELESDCRTYPVIWLALAGMHYCHAVWTYATGLICSR